MLPANIPIRTRAPLEIIRFSAASYLCVDLRYDGSVRRIEPYSLRQTADGNYVLHSIRADSGEHRSYRVDHIQGAAVTGQSFTPRYLVELTPESVAAAAARARGTSNNSRLSRKTPRRR